MPPEKPLTDQAIEAALAAPAMEVLRVRAAEIKHPILRPIDITPAGGLTPEQVAVIAVLANPSLRAARDARGVSAAQVLQAGLLPNPTLAFTNEFPFAGPDHLIAYGVVASWDVIQLVSRQAKVDAAAAQAASVDLDIAWQEWQTAQSARSSAYKVLSLQSQVELAAEADRLLLEDLQTVRQAVERQLKTEVDLSAAQAARQDSHSTLLQTQWELSKQTIQLNRLIGRPAGSQLMLREGRLSDQPPALFPARLEAGIEDRRLDLLALRRGYQSQEAAVRVAVLSRFAKFSPGLSTAKDTTGTYTAGYAIDVDLPIFDRNQGKIAIETATRQKLFDEFVNRVFEARNDIYAAAAEIESLKARIASAQEAVFVQQKLVTDYGQALRRGLADVVTYYSAWNDLNKKKIELVKLKQEMADALITLETSSGLYLATEQTSSTAPSQPSSSPSSQGAPQ